MQSLRLNQIEPDQLYQIDLVQQQDGCRFTHTRLAADPKHPEAALSTVVVTGVVLREYELSVFPKAEMKTECGKNYVLDGHGSWLTYEEAAYWKECRRKDKAEWPNGPWVNGLMPAQYRS